MKQIVVLLILSIMSFWLIADEIPFRKNPENFSDAKSNSDKSQHSFLCGLSFDTMLSEKEKLKPTYLIGYVNRKKSREKSFMVNGVSYKNFRYISLKYNKTFLYNNSPFIWGYHIGASYLRYVSVSWNPSGGDDELRKFYAPVLGGHFGLQWKIFRNRYISVSTEILSFQLPFNLLKITIK